MEKRYLLKVTDKEERSNKGRSSNRIRRYIKTLG